MAKRKAKELGDVSNEGNRRSSRRISTANKEVDVENDFVLPKKAKKEKKSSNLKVTTEANGTSVDAAESVS